MSEVIRKAFAFLAPDHPTVRAALAEIEQLQKDSERWRTEMSLRNDPAVAIMFAGTENRCGIYRRGALIASGDTYRDAIDAAIAAKGEPT